VIHAPSAKTCGTPRIHAELADEGIQVAGKRVERLMTAAGVAERLRQGDDGAPIAGETVPAPTAIFCGTH